MKNISLQSFVGLFVGVSALAWLGLAYAKGLDLSNIGQFLSLVPTVVSIDVFAFGIFAKWVWKWKVLHPWLVPFPDLNGTWMGEIRSDWTNPATGEKVESIPAMLTVKQSFFSISCVLHSQEMQSHSYSEDFQIDSDRQQKALSYLYSSKPRIGVSERSAPHDGAVVLNIIEAPELKLTGRYWTERKTVGELSFSYKTPDLLQEMPAEMKPHPVSKI